MTPDRGAPGARRDERFVALEVACNVRDLGGLPAADGRRTRLGRLFRADALCELPGADLEALRGLGLRTVLDLRWSEEVERDGRWPDDGLRYVHVPLFPTPEAFQQAGDGPSWEDIGARYLWALEVNREAVARALEVVADPATHPLAFHCTAGKDRTGVLAALVLACVHVDRDAIVADYALTETRMDAVVERLRRNPVYREGLDRTPKERLTAPAKAMRRFLALLDERHGGARAFALAAGVPAAALDRLDEALLERRRPS